MIQRLARHHGYRGVWLMLMGSVWVLFGLGALIDTDTRRSWVLFEYLPDWVNAAGWCLTGAVAIHAGWRSAGQDDSLGHVALYLMPFVRLASFALAWLAWLVGQALAAVSVNVGAVGYAQGWLPALVWSMVSAMLALAAAWPNPEPPIPCPPVDA